MADEKSKSGLWLDTDADKVVESEPVNGVQLVPKGGVITPDVQAYIDRTKAALKPSTSAPVDLSYEAAPPAAASAPVSAVKSTDTRKRA